MDTPSITEGMGRFVAGLSLDKVPPHIEEKLRTCLMYGIGIALSSTSQKEAEHARAAVLAIDGVREDGATLLVDGRKTTATGAAVANCVMYYGTGGQCDTMGSVHVGMMAIPVLLAMAETGAPMQRLLPALLAGYEVAGLLDGLFGRYSAGRGFRGTPVYGSLAVAAATSHMLELDAGQTANALAIAAAFTGGLTQPYNDGTAEPRHQPGSAIRNGVAAAQLARAGVVGAPYAIEGRNGLLAAFAGKTVQAADVLARLGHEWSTDRVTFKPYPVCAFNRTPIVAAAALREKLRTDQIEKVRVRMNSYETNLAGMDSKGPFATQTSHGMSIPFCVAYTLLRGEPFTVRPLNVFDDHEVYALVEKVDLITDDNVANLSAVIEVEMADGSTVAQRQVMTFADYVFPRPRVAQMVRRIGQDAGVSAQAFDAVDEFVDALPRASAQAVVNVFSTLASATTSRL